MTTGLLQGRAKSLTDLSGFTLSFILHLLLIVGVYIQSRVFPELLSPTRKLPPPSLKVDLVALPDHLKSENPVFSQKPPLNTMEQIQKQLKEAQNKVKQAKVPVLPVAKPGEMVQKPSQKQAEAPLSKTERANRIKNALARIKALNKISDEPAAPIIKGNKLSKGASSDENAVLSDETNYYDQLREHLRENWTLPAWLARQNFSARAILYIDERGKLVTYKMTKLSGNDAFDESVKRTIKESEPFPKPTKASEIRSLSNGIEVRFPL